MEKARLGSAADDGKGGKQLSALIRSLMVRDNRSTDK